MDGGDLMTRNRPTRGGDLMTISRQQNGGFLALLPKIFGFGPGEMQKQMSDPTKLQQVVMQRGGFPWALAGLSLLPMLMGKGKDDAIRKQMGTTRDPIMQRGGLSIPPTLLAKGLPLLKAIGIPLAMGALASVGDNVVDKVFGDGSKRSNGSSSSSRKKTPRAIRSGRRQRSTARTGSRRPRKTVGRTARRNKARTPKAGSKQQQQQRRRPPTPRPPLFHRCGERERIWHVTNCKPLDVVFSRKSRERPSQRLNPSWRAEQERQRH